MDVEPNILFAVHKGAPFFVGLDSNNHNLLQEGRPFYNAVTASDTGSDLGRCRCCQQSASRPMLARTCSINIPVDTTMTNCPRLNVSLSVFLTGGSNNGG